MAGHDIIVVGASAGGVEALTQLVANLPPDLPAAIFLVLHIPTHSTSFLPQILNRTIQKCHRGSSLHAVHPQDGEQIQHGKIYIAPPDRHLLVKEGYINLARGPRENSHRPAVDPLFRTAARAYGKRVIGIVLSGTLDDGTAGLEAIKQRGGVAIVQNPEEALYAGMPKSAIESVDVDYILQISEIAPLLVKLTQQPKERQPEEAMSSNMEIESDMAQLELKAMQNPDRPGIPSPFSCPECGGTLWELQEKKLTRYRCRTGHAFSTNSLMAQQSQAMEEALWVALRALEEKAALAHRMASQAHDRSRHLSAQRFESQKSDAQQSAAVIRELLLQDDDVDSIINGKVVRQQGQQEEVTKSSLPTDMQSSSLQLVAIGASAGGLKALTELLSALPEDFSAAIVVVQHIYPHYPSQLAHILAHRTSLQVKEAENNEVLRPGSVYIAPPNHHLLVNCDQTLSLTNSELVHFVRPSVDLLFESVAGSYKQRAIAIVLTGTGKDGAIGVAAIKKMGSKVIAQDQASSECFGMPKAAIDTGNVDIVIPLNEIAATLQNLVNIKQS